MRCEKRVPWCIHLTLNTVCAHCHHTYTSCHTIPYHCLNTVCTITNTQAVIPYHTIASTQCVPSHIHKLSYHTIPLPQHSVYHHKYTSCHTIPYHCLNTVCTITHTQAVIPYHTIASTQCVPSHIHKLSYHTIPLPQHSVCPLPSQIHKLSYHTIPLPQHSVYHHKYTSCHTIPYHCLNTVCTITHTQAVIPYHTIASTQCVPTAITHTQALFHTIASPTKTDHCCSTHQQTTPC